MKYLPVAILFLFTSYTGMGQCPSNRGQIDIAISYGAFSTDNVSLGASENNKVVTSYSGARFVSIRYFLFRVLAIGCTGGVAAERGQYNDAYNPAFIKSTYSQSVTTIAPEVYYVYTFRKYFEVYTILGFGTSFTTVSTSTNPTPYTAASATKEASDGLKMQYIPLGLRVGGRIAAFAELGFGYKGLLNAGLSCKLGRPCWWRDRG